MAVRPEEEQAARGTGAPFRRVLLKLSGEALMGDREFGLEPERIDAIAREVVATERGIYLASDEVQSKPEQARERIVDGMMNKRFFADRAGVLLDQPWVHEATKTVAQVLAEEGAEVLEFERLQLG